MLYVCWFGVYGLFGEQYCYGVVLGCVCSSRLRVDVAMCPLCCLGIEYDLGFGWMLDQYVFFFTDFFDTCIGHIKNRVFFLCVLFARQLGGPMYFT